MTRSDLAAEAAVGFVRRFHDDLSAWFAGEGEAGAVWDRLVAAAPADMRLVYPSGNRLSGAAFLDSIRDRWGKSPGFRAGVADVEVLHADASHAVLAYVESQSGARSSAATNRRSAMALVQRTGNGWSWVYIQETAQPAT